MTRFEKAYRYTKATACCGNCESFAIVDKGHDFGGRCKVKARINHKAIHNPKNRVRFTGRCACHFFDQTTLDILRGE